MIDRNNLIGFLLILIIYIPRLPIMQMGYGDSYLRVDIVLSVLLGAVFLSQVRSYIILLLVLVLFLILCQSENLIISAGLLFQVISIFLIPYFFIKNNYLYRSLNKIVRYSFYIIIINIFIAVIFRLFNIEYCINPLQNAGCVGYYGLLDRPYVFGIYSGLGLIYIINKPFNNLFIQNFFYFIIIYGMYLSDSRSIAVIFLFMGMIVWLSINRLKLNYVLYFIFIICIYMLFFKSDSVKMSFSNIDIINDPSWMMRSDNIVRYLDWVNIRKFLIGDGALAFNQFSMQYGEAGPVDNLYVRLLSEFGFIGSLILFSISFYPLKKIYNSKGLNLLFISIVLLFLVISNYQESLIIPKCGHLIFLFLAWLGFNFKRTLN